MAQNLKSNSLSITLFALFLIFIIGTSLVGHQQYNQEQEDHGQPQVSYWQYVTSGSFLETVMENWESEFLQMFAFVLLTTSLFQKGSSESKKLDESDPVDRDPRETQTTENAPWPVLKGGFVLTLYEHSLGIVLFILFAVFFSLHAIGWAQAYTQEQILHGGKAVNAIQYLGTAQFWFESLQNWQSEFFSVGMLVILSIFLRQRGSPQSKPVDTPHESTGEK